LWCTIFDLVHFFGLMPCLGLVKQCNQVSESTADGSQSLSFRRMHVAIIPALALPGLWIRRAKQSRIPIRISAIQHQVHGTPVLESFRRHTRKEQAEFVRTYEFESWQRNILHNVQTRSGPHSPPYAMDTGDCFPYVGEVNRPEREAEAVTSVKYRGQWVELYLHSTCTPSWHV
jgi:hypothetical protein